MHINNLKIGDKVRYLELITNCDKSGYINYKESIGEVLEIHDTFFQISSDRNISKQCSVKKEDVVAKINEEPITHEAPEYVVELDIKSIKTEYPQDLIFFKGAKETILYGNYGINIESSKLKILKDYLPIKGGKTYILTIKEKE